jgi:ribonuclease HII
MRKTSTAVHPFRPPRLVVRRDAGLSAYESALARAGFDLVAGADEAGRGACAGPLVVAACILPPGRRGQIDDLADSKLLTAATRERLYDVIVKRAVAYAVIVIPAAEVDDIGLHVANLQGMRRALAALRPMPAYGLTDGFAVPGLGFPATAVWKGDAVVGCIAAASILAKVSRDRLMLDLHEQWPQYEFAQHKGYVTSLHAAKLHEHGPCPQHRNSYVNVRRAAQVYGLPEMLDNGLMQPEETAL